MLSAAIDATLLIPIADAAYATLMMMLPVRAIDTTTLSLFRRDIEPPLIRCHYADY